MPTLQTEESTTTAGGITWTFNCNHYPTLCYKSADNFIIGRFTKVGAVNENVKGRRGMKKEDGNTSFKRMVNSKMKSKQNNQRRQKTIDGRGKKPVYKIEVSS